MGVLVLLGNTLRVGGGRGRPHGGHPPHNPVGDVCVSTALRAHAGLLRGLLLDPQSVHILVHSADPPWQQFLEVVPGSGHSVHPRASTEIEVGQAG